MNSIFPPSTSKPKGHYTPAVVHNGFVFVSGQISTDAGGEPILDSLENQTKRCLEKIKVLLIEANSSPELVVKVNIFISNMDDWARVNSVYAEFFGSHKPARLIVPCGPLHYGCAIEIDCIAGVKQSD